MKEVKVMLGAIIGDIINSYREVLEIEYFKKYHQPLPYQERIKVMDSNSSLLTENVSCTDDSILTCAIADAFLHHLDYEKYLREYGLKEMNTGFDIYGRSRFGSGFVKWLGGNYQGNSYGNGGAMRVSPIGYFDTLEEVKKNAYLATIPSHNHPEAMIGAEAVAVSIFLLRNGNTKEALKKYLQENYYSLDYDLEDLRKNYVFSSKTCESVPQALFCFLESSSFENALRIAASIGGDADTIGAIVGSLSEAYYGLDFNLLDQVKPYIKDYMWPVINEFYERKKVKCQKK